MSATREQRIVERTAKARSQFVQSTIGHGVNRVAGTVKAVGIAGAAMLGVGGAGLAASAVSQATNLDDRTRRLIIAGRAPGSVAQEDPDQLRKSLSNIGVAHGLSPEDVTGGTEAYVTKTGNLGDAMKYADTFATAAQAAGSSMTDIANIGAEMAKKFDIKTVEEMQQVFADLIFGGKKNAFVLKDMAPVLTEVMAGMKGQAGLSGVKGMRTVGGLMQMAKEGTGSSEGAATALDNVLKQLVARSDEIQSGGFGDKVQIFEGGDAKKPMRDLMDIIPEMVSSVKGDIVKLNEIFQIRGSRAFNPITGVYRTTRAATAGTEKEKDAASLAAVKKALEGFTAPKGANFAEVQKDETSAMKSFSVQMEMINSKLKEVVASQLFPEIIKLAPELEKLVPIVGDATRMFVNLVKSIAEHPISAVGAAIAVQLTADIAKAKIGELIATLIANSSKTSLPSALTPGAAGGAAGLGSGASGAPSMTGGVVGLFSKLLPGAQLVQDASDKAKKLITGEYEGAVAGDITSGSKLAEKVAGGGATPEDVAAAQKQLTRLKDEVAGGTSAKDEAGKIGGDLFGDISRLGTDLFGKGGAQAAHEADKAAAEKLDQLKAAVETLQKALETASGKIASAGAAVVSGASQPNRSNVPSPVKP